MKICIFGAGGIGGYMAVELSLAGYDVCAIARGVHPSGDPATRLEAVDRRSLEGRDDCSKR
jgi:prephenate dehydrogenase